jgi:glutamate/tyrosine decarboxylase-like PLP-dependent enzyme
VIDRVFGGDVHVVWEKFCRYFDVEPRIVPLKPGKYTIGADDVQAHIDENTIGVAAVLGTTFTGHKDDIVGINDLLLRIKHERGLDVPLHVDAASGGFVWPFLYPDSKWDFRLEQVRSINVSMGRFEIIGRTEEQLPLVAFRLAEDTGYDEFDIAWQLAAERGWMVPAYTLPPNAQDVTIMRALVKETLSREHVDTLARDIEEACSTLAKKGGAHQSERNKIVTGPGH